MGEESRKEQAEERKKARAPRDPERRKRQIAEAAAELISQEGTGTSRIAASLSMRACRWDPPPSTSRASTTCAMPVLRCLQSRSPLRNQEMLAQVGSRKMGVEMLCDFVVAYLADERQVSTDAMFYAAAVSDPEVGGLWKRALVENAQDYAPLIGLERLQILSTFLTGLIIDTAIYGASYDSDTIRAAIVALVGEDE